MQRAMILLVAMFCPCLVEAQVPRTVAINVYLESSGLPMQGIHTLDIRWYAQIAGGSALHTETLEVQIEHGVAALRLGEQTLLPDSLFVRGPLWIGISVDGDVELSPRTMIVSVPFAITADRARIAQALAPEVTGVVTSINEIGGSVRIVGTDGVQITRNGNLLEIACHHELEQGTVSGTGQHVFTITPQSQIASNMLIDVHVVSPDALIACTVKTIDVITNTITVVTSAPLLDTEHIEWKLHK